MIYHTLKSEKQKISHLQLQTSICFTFYKCFLLILETSTENNSNHLPSRERSRYISQPTMGVWKLIIFPSSSCAWKGRKSRAPKQRTLRRPGHGGHGLTRGFEVAWLWVCFTRGHGVLWLGGFWKGGEIMQISLKGRVMLLLFFLLNENGYDMEMM